MQTENECVDDSEMDSISSQIDVDINSPTVTFSTVTFSDGSKFELGSTDVVVLVGPNNSGKSEALRELENLVSGISQTKVIQSVSVLKSGELDEFSAFVEKNLQHRIENGNHIYYGYDFSVGSGSSELSTFWPDRLDVLRALFCRRLLTETRITDSNAANSIDLLNEPPSHPIHLLLDDEVELRISGFFRRAFDEDLILSRQGGSVLPLLTGDRPIPNYAQGEDRVSKSYLKRMVAATVPLQNQGDGMRSFASVILHLLAPVTPSILLIDEPEAFLHPPQARLIGEIIGQETSVRAQLIVATHSPDVLQGLVDRAAKRLRILRIQRTDNVNHVTELNNNLVRRVGTDSLLKYSSVLSGVFHERVIVCESDADCLFYNSILGVPDVHGSHHPDVLFIHGGSKDRMDHLAETLVALDVKVDVIADIDIIRDLTKFKSVVETLGGDWALVGGLAKSIRAAVEDKYPTLNAGQIIESIRTIIDQPTSASDSPRHLEKQIRARFRQASPWESVKDAGEDGIPKGQATSTFNELKNHCKQFGLWIVPVGELEGFCRSVGGHGPRWVGEVLEKYDVETSPELGEARDFVREIWIT